MCSGVFCCFVLEGCGVVSRKVTNTEDYKILGQSEKEYVHSIYPLCHTTNTFFGVPKMKNTSKRCKTGGIR